MRPRPALALLAALVAVGALAGCGNGMPRTSANVAICTTLARVLASKTDVHKLAGLAFESRPPVSHQLRQDIASYVMLAVRGSSSAHHAAASAEIECAAIDAPVAPGFG
jgi:hypothetical protein